MKQVDLANQIGVTDRTIRRMSKRKQQQWQSLAAKGRDVRWFDLLAQLCFEVDAFNREPSRRLALELGNGYCALSYYTGLVVKIEWTINIENSADLVAAIEKVKQLDGVKE